MVDPTPKSRNAALALVSRVNRWLLAASVAATAVFALLAEHAFPGHSAARSSGASAGAITTQASSTGNGASSSNASGGSSLQQPSSTPSASPSPSSSVSPSPSGSVVSGGS